MTRDENFWIRLMSLGFNRFTAPDEFNRICASNGGLKTCHPLGPELKPVWVTFDPQIDCDHFLFKSESDTHGGPTPCNGYHKIFAKTVLIAWVGYPKF